MPLNGRNVINLVTLVPGVVAQGNAMTNPTGQNIFSFGNYQIDGGIAGQNATFLDGAPLNVAQGSLIALIPTQDAMQEFKVQTNSLGPEFGRFAGGVINLTSKSGSNEFHGQLYEFLRNKVLNANTFFNNRAGLSTPSFTQNQYGANIGGPIKKDKTFFFFAWEGFRVRQRGFRHLRRTHNRTADRRFLEHSDRERRSDCDIRSEYQHLRRGQLGFTMPNSGRYSLTLSRQHDPGKPS